MASLFTSLTLWTLKENLITIRDGDVGCNVYHDKGETVSNQGYQIEKKNYVESRGNSWTLSNKRPEKLRDNLKDLEELCSSNRCIFLEWKARHIIQAVFNNGVFVNIFINISTGELEKLSFDKYLLGKLHSEHVVDMIQDENNIIFSYVEPKLTHVQLSKKPQIIDNGKKWDKLSSLNPKVLHIDLVGPSGRRLERKLSCNVKHNLLMLWWRTSNDEIWPWTPLSTEKERANIHLYSMNGSKFELVSYCRTEVAPLIASFSKLRPHQILTLEQKIMPNGDVFVDRCVYEITLTKLQRVAIASIPLKSHVVCQEQNLQEDKILIACGDNNLILYDDYRRTSQTTKLPFIPTAIAWHPNGSVAIVSSDKGEILCFDQALSSIKFKLVNEEPDSKKSVNICDYFRVQPKMAKIVWSTSNQISPENSYFPPSDNIIVYLERGPFALLQVYLGVLNRTSLTPIEIASQFVKYQQVDEAINLLGSLNWNVEGQVCYFILTLVINHLLRMTLNADREAQLEAALGTFYAPIRPLTKITILEYRDRIRNLARRFFHHLLRFQRLEKASLLAVDIGSSDLFKDLFHMAMEKGNHALAEVALRNAEGIDESIASETDTGDSQDFDDYSESSYSSDCSEHDLQKKEKEATAESHVLQSSNLKTEVPLGKIPSHLQKPKNANLSASEQFDRQKSGSKSSFKQSNMDENTPIFNPTSTSTPAHSGQIVQTSSPVMQPIKGSGQLPSHPNSFQRHQDRARTNSAAASAPEINNIANFTQRMKLNTDAEFRDGARNYGQTQTSLRKQNPIGNQTRHENLLASYNQKMQRSDPNEQFVDSDQASSVESDDEQSGTVKVVHFGVV